MTLAPEASHPADLVQRTTSHVPTGGDVNGTVAHEPQHLPAPQLSLSDPDLPERIARFLVRQLLGEGAFGRVYRAYDEQLDREVAVKVAKAETLNNSRRVERFLREARTAAQLQHPHIVPLYDAGRDDGQYYIASAFVTGRTLEGTLESGRLDFRHIAAIVRSLAEALAYAHDQGIVHRDVKPANIMIDDKGQPQLMDFGLAAREDESAEKLTHDGSVMGTPMYMAPEQAAGRSSEVGPASDQYSLGVVFYEMLCGRPPFSGSIHVVMSHHRETEPPAPRTLEPNLSRDLETICLKMLAKRPGERFAGCRELAEDLRRFLDDEPIRARQAGLVERTVKWARRNKAKAGLVAVSAFALITVLSSVLLYQAQEIAITNAKLKKAQDEDRAQKSSQSALLEAQRHEATGRWTEADRSLAEALATLDAQPDLEVDELRAEIESRRLAVGQRLLEQKRRKEAQTRLSDFQKTYDEAVLNATGATSQDVADNRAKIQVAAQKALAIYRIELATAGDGNPRFDEDRASLDAADFARLTEACYGLLLIWANAESAPPVEVESPEGRRERGKRALIKLDGVGRFGKAHGVDTRAFHLHKAQLVALSTGKAFDRAALDPAAPSLPTGALDWFLEGLDTYRTGQYESAARACDEVLKREGGHYWARYVRALCRLRESRWGEAKADLTVCVNARPDDPWPRLLRGLSESELGFRSVLPREAKQAAAEYKAAGEDLDAVLKKERDPLVRYVGLTNRGVSYIRQGRYDEAEDDLRDAVKVNPSAFQAHINLSQALQGQEKWDAALSALNDAIRLAPTLAALYESRARLHLSRKNRPAARADFEKAASLVDPMETKSDRHVGNLVEVGRLLHREHNYRAALDAFDQALKLRPNYVVTQRFRAKTLLALHRTNEAGQALDDYLAVTKEAPAAVYQDRGLIHAGVGQQPAALDMYSAALRQNPRDTVTRGYRGWTYLSIDAPRLALADFEAWLREVPSSAEALIGRGSARIRLRRLEEAVADASAAEKQGPLTDRLTYNLACIYAQAVGLAEAERPTQNSREARLAIHYEQKATQHLRRAMEELSAERRSAFWQKQVLTDPALASVRRGKSFAKLTQDYGRLSP